MKSLIAILDKMKADLEDDANMKYLQIFQYICNRETIASLDFESVKKVEPSVNAVDRVLLRPVGQEEPDHQEHHLGDDGADHEYSLPRVRQADPGGSAVQRRVSLDDVRRRPHWPASAFQRVFGR
jgi:hypothetical protein